MVVVVVVHQLVFLSTLSLRRATASIWLWVPLYKYFYPRSPCGERRRGRRCCRPPARISIHALLAESDKKSSVAAVLAEKFLSTLSLRRATAAIRQVPLLSMLFLSTLSLRRATEQSSSYNAYLEEFLSTLSLRRATEDIPELDTLANISIHALLAESDRGEHHANSQQEKFLSTLSLRRAT